MRLRTLSLVSVALAALGTAFAAAPAQAAAAERPRHCVANVANPSAPVRCYDNFTTAIAKATGGRVTDAPADVRAALRDTDLLARLDATAGKGLDAKAAHRDPTTLAADVLISIEYWDSDFEGSTYTWTAPWGCTTTTGDTDWSAATLVSNWNDEIGSYRGFSNCWVKHFEHIHFGGLCEAFAGDDADLRDNALGADVASSLRSTGNTVALYEHAGYRALSAVHR